MNEADIIKALEIHADTEADCSGCPIYHSDTGETCVYELSQNALDLINRQKAEIERLEKHNTEYARKHYNDGRAEAITEFEQRLKAESSYGTINISPLRVDQIAKELKEGVNNEG